MDLSEDRPDPDARLALIEVLGRDGQPQRWVDVVRWPLTMGRALDNDLVLDDAHVAPHHARLEPDMLGRLQLFVLATVNGVRVGADHHQAGETVPLPPGTPLRLGPVRLRLRLPGEPLADEQAIPARPRGLTPALPLVAAALMLLALASHWLTLDPGADATVWLPPLVGLPVVLAAWCGLWALMSKLFQNRFDIAGHLRIVLPWLLAIELVDLIVPQVAASFGWATLWYLENPLQAVLAVLMLRDHLTHLLPQHSRAVSATVLALGMAGAGISGALNERRTDRFFRAPYMSTLPLPAFNATTPVAPASLVQDMAPLAQKIAVSIQPNLGLNLT